MLSNIFLFILCILNPVLAIYCYKLGQKDTKLIDNTIKEKTSVKLPKIRLKTKEQKIIEKEQAQRLKEFQEKMKTLDEYNGG